MLNQCILQKKKLIYNFAIQNIHTLKNMHAILNFKKCDKNFQMLSTKTACPFSRNYKNKLSEARIPSR